MKDMTKTLLTLSAATIMALSTGCSSSDDSSGAAANTDTNASADANGTKKDSNTTKNVVTPAVDDPTRVVYRSNQINPSQHDLYVNNDGSWATLFAANHTDESVIDFQLSPNKDMVVFRVQTPTGKELYIQSLNGTDAELVYNKSRDGILTSENDVASYAWSNDGKKVAYIADQNLTFDAQDLFVYHLESKRNTSINTIKPNKNAKVTTFSWASNSDYIAFIADRNITAKKELFVMNPAGNDLVVASENDPSDAVAQVSQAYWAPDSHAIAYIANEITGSGTELHIAQQDADGTVTILPSIGIATAGKSVASAQWSPASDRIAYISNDDSAAYNIYTVYPSLNTVRKRIKTSTGTYPNSTSTASIQYVWSPDSTTLAYTASTTSQHNDLFYVSATGETSTMANIESTYFDAGIPPFIAAYYGGVSQFTFSSDSKLLAYNANTDTVTKDLYVTTVASNNRVRVAGTERQGGVVTQFAFAPNDSKLVYIANQDNTDNKINLYTASVSKDGNGTQINDGANVYADVKSFRITADSDTVVFSEDKTDDNMNELYSVGISGGANTKLSDMFLTSDGDVDGDFVTR